MGFTWSTGFLYEHYKRVLRKGPYKNRLGMNPNNKLVVSRHQYEQYYRFSFVRNPWARAVSLYNGLLRDEIHVRNQGMNNYGTFKDFLKEHAGKGWLRPQLFWLRSIDGTIKLDFIGKFESLHEDFHKICSSLNVPPIDLPHVLKGSGESYTGYYDNESREIVSRIYGEEIELFNYSFGTD